MPHQTFFNLPAEKRERIVQSAIDEFLRVPYEKTSINHIIEGADIPKGSFYQYFENKDDLYVFCIMQFAELLITSQVGRWHSDVLKSVLALPSENEVGTALHEDQTQAMAIIGERNYRFFKGLLDAPHPLRNEIFLRIAKELYRPLMRKELEADNRLRKDIDLDYYAYLLSMAEFISMQYGSDLTSSTKIISNYTLEYIKCLYSSILSD